MMLFFASIVNAADCFVNFSGEGWMLNRNSKVTISLKGIADKGIARAVRDLSMDIQKVCEAEVLVADNDDATIVIRVNPKMNATEKYIIDIDGQGQMTITGSDKRGTIYGIYEFRPEAATASSRGHRRAAIGDRGQCDA